MKQHPLVTTRVTGAQLLNVRDRARQIAGLFQLDRLQTTRFVTAVSEIARNTADYAVEGTASFFFEEAAHRDAPQYVGVTLADKGPGIERADDLLAGARTAHGAVPVGLAGARRLVDVFAIDTAPGRGTTVTLRMALPRAAGTVEVKALSRMMDDLTRQRPPSALEELERQNREMLATLDELRVRQTELQRADERKNNFLAMLAHELRTPLGTLQMMLEIIARNPQIGADELERRRAVMARQTEQMTRLVADLMDVSRVSQGKVELARVPIEINELVAQSVEAVTGMIGARHHQLHIDASPVELWSVGDPARLRQVFTNLLQNAARYTPDGGEIRVGLSREGASAVIRVADNGVGIEPDTMPHIFDLFVQGHPGAVEGHSGLGIGLTLVRRLVGEHGGEVMAESAGQGKGSTFTVRIPLTTT
ncbi:MAG: sensor histidine kinase [Burkholderiales bacterium]|jgi:signal transduction histidine kinase|nr:sensor histidine kinase [Burkholderiales bacterium]